MTIISFHSWDITSSCQKTFLHYNFILTCRCKRLSLSFSFLVSVFFQLMSTGRTIDCFLFLWQSQDLSLAPNLFRVCKCLNQKIQWFLKFYWCDRNVHGCCSGSTCFIHSSQHHTWLLWKWTLCFHANPVICMKDWIVRTGHQTSLFDCICRKAKIVAVGLILWFLSACWDRARFPVDQIKISKSLLFSSFHETSQPESSLRAVGFNIVHHTRYPFFLIFFFLLCQWFTPSPGSPCAFFDLRMLFCAKSSLSKLSLMEQNHRV